MTSVHSSIILPVCALLLTACAGPICANPTAADAGRCRRIEALILKSTVRFVIETWTVRADEPGYHTDYSTGYGTVKNGRYLVTHNHFSGPLSIRPRAGEPEAYGALTLFNSQGEPRFRGSLSDFNLVWEDPETLVIGHEASDFFEKLGFISAEFYDRSSVSLVAGMEVAQVDWDGTATRVDWTTVKEIGVVDGLPWLILTDEVTVGASGGGVFWQGVHIANNSRLVVYMDESGAQIGASTKAALNSVHVAGEPYRTPSLLADGNGFGEAGE
jgi:hypothetical protein